MVIDMDETWLRTIEQVQEFLRATSEVAFTAPSTGGATDNRLYEHISRVLARFDYPGCGKHDRGVMLVYLRRTSGYSRAQLTRLVSRWTANRVAQDLVLARTMMVPSGIADHTRRVPGFAPTRARISAGTVVCPLEVMVDSATVLSLTFVDLVMRSHGRTVARSSVSFRT